MKINLALILIVLALINVAKADVAPDPDEIRVYAPLTISTNEDLSDYRFFLDFMGAVHEIEITSKGQTVVPAVGGGARYSSGKVLAIPKKNLTGFPEKLESPYNEKNKPFSDAISNRKIAGIIQLTRHSFGGTIKKSERVNWTYPVYRIEKDGDSIKMVEEYKLAPKMSLEEQKLVESGWYFWPTIVAGVLIAFAVFITGVFVVRKVLKKS